MSIQTQIQRLINNRNSIRNALARRGISAEDHTTDDFANDILAIPSGGGGTDVSDTTATASDVLDDKYFYTSNGVKTKGELALTNLTPSEEGQTITNGTTYKANADGYAINDYENIVPTENGVKFNAGFSKLAAEGYAYSTRPSGSNENQFMCVVSYGGYCSYNSKKLELIECKSSYSTFRVLEETDFYAIGGTTTMYTINAISINDINLPISDMIISHGTPGSNDKICIYNPVCHISVGDTLKVTVHSNQNMMLISGTQNTDNVVVYR